MGEFFNYLFMAGLLGMMVSLVMIGISYLRNDGQLKQRYKMLYISLGAMLVALFFVEMLPDSDTEANKNKEVVKAIQEEREKTEKEAVEKAEKEAAEKAEVEMLAQEEAAAKALAAEEARIAAEVAAAEQAAAEKEAQSSNPDGLEITFTKLDPAPGMWLRVYFTINNPTNNIVNLSEFDFVIKKEGQNVINHTRASAGFDVNDIQEDPYYNSSSTTLYPGDTKRASIDFATGDDQTFEGYVLYYISAGKMYPITPLN